MNENSSWQKLSGDDYIKAVKAVNAVFDNERFSVKSSTMEIKTLPFYKTFKLLKAVEKNSYPRYVINFLYNENDIVKLDYSADTISKANALAKISLNSSNLNDYLKFFFSSIRGENNSVFQIVENPSEVLLKGDALDETKEEIAKKVSPLVIEQKDDGNFKAKASIVHQNSLYDAEIKVSKEGVVEIITENEVMFNLPIKNNMLK